MTGCEQEMYLAAKRASLKRHPGPEESEGPFFSRWTYVELYEKNSTFFPKKAVN